MKQDISYFTESFQSVKLSLCLFIVSFVLFACSKNETDADKRKDSEKHVNMIKKLMPVQLLQWRSLYQLLAVRLLPQKLPYYSNRETIIITYLCAIIITPGML